MKYILNKETNKIELHTTKEEYMQFTTEEKREIKSCFQFSRYGSCWASRSKNYHGRAIETAKKLGFENGGETGERLSFEEQQERKATKAEHRADRYEQYAENAEKRAENLQADFNSKRDDWAYITQPNINTASGRAFTNQREKTLNRYRKGFEERNKGEYFKERAEIAKETAEQKKLKEKPYLYNKIEECKKYKNKLDKLSNMARFENNDKYLDRLTGLSEENNDKLSYYEKKLEEVGGIQFNNKNVKAGDLVKINHYKDWEKVVKANAKTVQVEHLKYSYACIKEHKPI